MVLCRDKGSKGSDSVAIISNNRPFIGITDAIKISAGTDDGIMYSNPFPFDFYYNDENIKQGIRLSGNTFAYLTPNLTVEELKINRRDAVCKGLYREDHEDYVRLVWIGYSHYSASNQTEANRLEWEIYFFKDENIIEVVIGKTPRTSGSVDYFDTKGGKIFNGPFEAGCSYVFKGDETGKNFKVYPQSHFEKPQYLERDIAIIGENGEEKLVYPTTIASNTLVEQDDGTYEKLSDVLKNLKGGGDYEFLPVRPNDYLTFTDKGEYDYAVSIFSKAIKSFYWKEDGTIRFINTSNAMAYFKLDGETGEITRIKSYDTTQEIEALKRLRSLRTCTVIHEQRLYAFSYVSSTPKGLAFVEIDLNTGEIISSGLDTRYTYDRIYCDGIYCPHNDCLYLIGTSYKSSQSSLCYAVYNVSTRQIISEKTIQKSSSSSTTVPVQVNYRNLTRAVFNEDMGNGEYRATVFGAFSSGYYQSYEITLSYNKSYISNSETKNISALNEFNYDKDGVFYDTDRNVLTIFRGDTSSHTARYDEYTITSASNSSDIANSKVSLLEKILYRTIDECETVQTPSGLYLIGGMVWSGNSGSSHKRMMLYLNRKTKQNIPKTVAYSNIESQSKRINPFISCSSVDRPIVEDIGFQIYDTDLKTPMWWDGEQWTAGMIGGGSQPPGGGGGGSGDDNQEFHLYRAEIYSTNGTIFRNGEIMTTLKARLYDFDQNITTELHPSQYKWSRVSKDEASDIIWDNQHSEGSYEINITASDVRLRAVFYLDVVDENGLSLLNCQASTG